jgi:glutathione S-transferase
LDILSKINEQIQGEYFFGDNIQKIDICILPFIRQFRIADIKWFDDLDEIQNVKKYLNNFLNSELLVNIMHKYKKWEEGDDPQTFPYKPIES